MKFCTVALQHTAGEIREKAEKIIISMYREVGAPVKDYLPPDDDKTRKNVLYKQLFEAFDKIDGKPSKEELKVIASLEYNSHTCSNLYIMAQKKKKNTKAQINWKH